VRVDRDLGFADHGRTAVVRDVDLDRTTRAGCVYRGRGRGDAPDTRRGQQKRREEAYGQDPPSATSPLIDPETRFESSDTSCARWLHLAPLGVNPSGTASRLRMVSSPVNI